VIVRSAAVAFGLVTLLIGRSDAQDSRLQSKLDPPTYAVIQALLDSAKRAKLPVKSIEDRALEGAGSGVTDEAIIAGVRKFTAQLGIAYTTLGPDAKGEELRAAVSAIDAGIPPRDLMRVRRAAAKGRTITTACTVLADIAGRGVPPAAASDDVVKLLDAKIKDPDLMTFGRWVRQDIEKGADPTTAAKVRAQGMVTAAGGRMTTPRGSR
jgi:hypothetical protein